VTASIVDTDQVATEKNHTVHARELFQIKSYITGIMNIGTRQKINLQVNQEVYVVATSNWVGAKQDYESSHSIVIV
jgi:hypothetical protein